MTSWLLARRLQTQLLFWTALIVVVSVGVTFEIRTRLNLRMLEQNLRDRTETLVRSVENTLTLGSSQIVVPERDLEGRLGEFADAVRTLTRLDVVEVRDGVLRVAASSSASRKPVIDAIPARLTTDIRTVGGERAMISVQPVPAGSQAVVAMASLENLDRYEASNHSSTLVFSGILIVIVIVLMHVMYKRTVSKRFDELLSGIRRAQEGNFAERIPDDRQDEIGVIASTLNSLLTKVRSFNDELQREVAHATENLNRRNLTLEEATRQMVEMQHQLLQAERLATVGQMGATFAHEIGSPMSSLSAHVQLLLEDPGLSDEQRETMGIIRQQIQSMVQTVNDLLHSARRGPGDFVPADVNQILRTVLRLVNAKLMSRNIDVRAQLRDVPKVRAYPLYLQEAFLNLINNASDAMPHGGQLELKTWFDPASERVNIRIADTGPGIDPSLVADVFKHFVSTKALGDGTGLGLGIVKDIVTSHRGTINIAPANGRGTAAHLTFPPDPVRVKV